MDQKKYLVVYSSLTGNTKKVADAIVEELGVEETNLQPVENNPEYKGYDLVVVGYWVDRGTADAKSKKYLESIRDSKVAVFATLGADPKSEHGTQSLDSGVALLDASNEVVGKFICQGKVSEKMIEMMLKMFGTSGHPHSVDAKRRALHEQASTHPDAEDLAAAKAVFKEIKENLGRAK